VARLWPALCGLFSLFLTWHLAVLLARQAGGSPEIGRRAGLWSVLMLVSTLWHGFYARGLTLDMMLSCWLLAALYCFIRAQGGVSPDTSTPPQTARWMLACWLALAAAVMTKGPVGLVLPGMALVL
jgi:4-amino-4-deoxy-L-arabinose transferase-like glycosyltransferase